MPAASSRGLPCALRAPRAAMQAEGWRLLAMDFELTGGLIKQAVACALSMAIA